MPEVLPTISSPLQYHYRTKLTPHFDLPRKGARNAPDTKAPVDPAHRPEWLNIGFNRVGTRKVLDIEVSVLSGGGTSTLTTAGGMPDRDGDGERGPQVRARGYHTVRTRTLRPEPTLIVLPIPATSTPTNPARPSASETPSRFSPPPAPAPRPHARNTSA